ncbi:MAG: hypothetical protein NC548_45260 [Lachnospiraceae bacterium]|nr:hypothetical protein [Lachnospiraceae bacterium]
MKIYILIHEQDTDDVCGCDVKPFLSRKDAQAAMRKDFYDEVVAWDYRKHEHHDEDEATYGVDSSVLREGGNVESWRIEEHDLDVRVAVEVKGGMVQNIYANADVSPDVYDLDVSDFPEEGEEDEADKKEAELKELVESPGWRNVW